MHNSAQGSENQTTATIVKDSWSIICIWGVLSTQPTGGHRSVPEAPISILFAPARWHDIVSLFQDLDV